MANTFEEEQNHQWIRNLKRGLYLLVEIPMLVFDRATVRTRDRMPSSIKNALPFLACREYSLYFEPRVICKVGRKYEHEGIMKLICRHYCGKSGACGRYSNGNRQRKN